ncbi:MAG: helix-hairpin-helix domain-containing protein [Bacteroidales bacterium]|nr:helix-hairpin-helix domain-containing protein [Bacteroidales bacterium]
MSQQKEGKGLSASFVVGAVALAFLITGYQTALFVHRAATLHIAGRADRPDTVYIIERISDGSASSGGEAVVSRSGQVASSGTSSRTVRRNALHSPAVQEVRERYAGRTVESFPFDPNTISLEDLQRLGFSQRQAQSIINYRNSGGRFRRKEDFAKSYVVDDSVFQRLAPYIEIPSLDLNKADSAAFDALPGIGPYYASRMVSYRKELRGYSYKEQLLDIKGFDRERYDGLQDLVSVGPTAPYPIWTLPEDSLRLHPYIDKYVAHGIVLYRDYHPRSQWTVEGLADAGVLNAETAGRLTRCRLAPPEPE